MISIISSTNRSGATSYQVAKYYQTILESKGEECIILDLEKLPTDFAFSALYDNAGKNDDFNFYRETMVKSDKFIFVIPEYNGSFPGVLKTFIDGQDFPGALKFKKAALIGISSGAQGGGLAMSHFTDILNYLNCFVVPIKPRITAIEKAFFDGEFVHPLHKELIESQLDLLLNY